MNLQEKIYKLTTLKKWFKLAQLITLATALLSLVAILITFIVDIIIYETEVPVLPIFNKLYLTFLIVALLVGAICIALTFVVKKIENELVDATLEKEKSGSKLLVVENLKKYFPVEKDFFGKPIKWLHAVEDVSFTLDEGKTLGIVGESGCGKTTLGRTILKLYDIQGGNVFFQGKNITNLTSSQMIQYRTDIQYVFQDPYSSLPPRLPIGEIIAEPVRIHNIVKKDEVKSYVLKVMRDCGLQAHFYDRYPHEFSGGQRQRICIARALAVKPKLIILDEPVSALDVSIQAQIINLLKKLQEKYGYTYLFITHDISVVKYVSDEIGVMYLGSMVEKGSKDSIFEEPLHPYTKALFSAVPIADPKVKMNRVILKGDIPSPSNPPKGCKFHTRCDKCMKQCSEVAPEFKEVRPGHFVACHLFRVDKYRIIKKNNVIVLEKKF